MIDQAAFRTSFLIVLSFSLCLVSSRLSAGSGGGHLGYLVPKSAKETSGSPWGIQAGTLKPQHLSTAAAIGVKWTRLTASWREVEVERGRYDWGRMDEAIGASLDNGITPLVCLAVSNRLYCRDSVFNDEREREIYGTNPLPPTRDPGALEAWLRYVREAVARYRGRVRHWEVWNEPNHWAYWGAPPDGAEYGLLLRKSAEVIKRADPAALVFGGATAGLDPEFTDAFLRGGAAAMIDGVTFHNYAPLPEERIGKAWQVREVLDRHNPALAFWQGECGYPSHSSTRDYRGVSPWGVGIQAKWLLRQALVDVYFCRVQVSIYFKLVHEGGRGKMPSRSSLTALDSVLGFPERGGSRVKSVGVNEKCILENPGLAPKPAYYAYRNLCAVFDGRYAPAKVRHTVSVLDPGVFYGVGPEDDAFPSTPLVAAFAAKSGARLVAWWVPWQPQELVRPARIDLKLEGVRFDEPVYVDLLTGAVRAADVQPDGAGGSVVRGAPMLDYPMVLAERREVGRLREGTEAAVAAGAATDGVGAAPLPAKGSR